MQKNTKSIRGFTLVELLIVIVVIAILAAISIVAYNGIQNRSKNTAAQALASQVIKKAEAHNTIQSNYPATVSAFEDTDESSLQGLTVAGGTERPANESTVNYNLAGGCATVTYATFPDGSETMTAGDC